MGFQFLCQMWRVGCSRYIDSEILCLGNVLCAVEEKFSTALMFVGYMYEAKSEQGLSSCIRFNRIFSVDCKHGKYLSFPSIISKITIIRQFGNTIHWFYYGRVDVIGNKWWNVLGEGEGEGQKEGADRLSHYLWRSLNNNRFTIWAVALSQWDCGADFHKHFKWFVFYRHNYQSAVAQLFPWFQQKSLIQS